MEPADVVSCSLGVDSPGTLDGVSHRKGSFSTAGHFMTRKQEEEQRVTQSRRDQSCTQLQATLEAQSKQPGSIPSATQNSGWNDEGNTAATGGDCATGAGGGKCGADAIPERNAGSARDGDRLCGEGGTASQRADDRGGAHPTTTCSARGDTEHCAATLQAEIGKNQRGGRDLNSNP